MPVLLTSVCHVCYLETTAVEVLSWRAWEEATLLATPNHKYHHDLVKIYIIDLKSFVKMGHGSSILYMGRT